MRLTEQVAPFQLRAFRQFLRRCQQAVCGKGELLRIAAILRRVPTVENRGPKFLTLGPMRFDTAKGELWNGDTPIRLTGSEQTLMRRLAETPGEAVDRPTLIEELGREPDDAGENSDRAIDVQITRLRRKIEPDPREPRYLQTVRGTGYMLVPD